MGKVMLYGGIDIGSLTAQAVLIDGKRQFSSVHNSSLFLAKSIPVKPNPVDSAKAVMEEIFRENGLEWKDLNYCISTGYGREKIVEEGMANENVSEISCHATGAFSLDPDVRTVIDIGGQDAKVIRIDESGNLVNFVMNDKCAAGTGRFLEVMSRTLGVSLEDLGGVALKARGRVDLSARCSIFAETEVLHFLQRGIDVGSLAAGICRSMAERVMALVRRVGVEKEVMMTGGVAKNVAVKRELERMIGTRMVDSKIDSQLVGAYGAAVLAMKSGRSV